MAFRQAYAGTELVSRNGEPWAFLKEISSDGNMQTIDVTYPATPVFLYADPDYLGLLLAPILDYVENHGYPKVFAPHDLDFLQRGVLDRICARALRLSRCQ